MIPMVEAKFKAGTHIFMGDRYWRVLKVDKEADTALIISEKPVCRRVYHDKKEDVTWEKCDLRSWLNGEYYETTFSDEEKTAIIETELDNPDNTKHKTHGGNKTRDKVFLLSIDEARRMMINQVDRHMDACWLRSPGGYSGWSAYVKYGCVNDVGESVDRPYNAVRPAFKINLKSDLINSFISIDSKGDRIISSPAVIIRNDEVIGSHPMVKDVILPGYVKTIAEGAFKDCAELTSITWEGKIPTIKKGAFSNCPNLRLPAELYTGNKLPVGLVSYMPTEPSTLAAVLRLGKSIDFATPLDARTYVSEFIKGLTVDLLPEVTDEFIVQTGDSVLLWPELLLRFAFASGAVIGKDRIEKLVKILRRSKQKFSKSLLMKEVENGAPSEIEGFWFDYWLSPKVMQTEIEISCPLSVVLRATWPIAGAYAHVWVPDTKNYKKDALDVYRKIPESDTNIAKTEHEALMQLLLLWQKKVGTEWYAPYAAFANDEELSALLLEMKSWEKNKNLKEQIIKVRGAVLLNDTVTAMRYADSLGLLDRYASLRGLDADTIRDGTISDFGLDVNGFRSWTLGGRRITAKLEDDLTLSLSDDSGKELRSVPKKGAEPSEYEAVSKEYSDMKKAIKATAKTRNDKIFADFLSGRERPGSDWKKAYLNNPVLRVLARLIVWEQDGTTFTLDNEGNACDVNGAAYVVTETPVKVAHPMEMSKEAIEKWQRYYNDRNLRQPFEQVWEPVADASLVKPGRYNDCTVPLYALMNKDKHGIIMEGQSRITLKDCSAGLKLIAGHKDWINNEFEVTDFTFEKYTRQVNHIVVMLDKATVAGRIKKDDISVAQWLDLFTLAQIMSFIDIANEADAFNVKAMLLEYKNTHFADFDPMEQFTLEW